MSPCPQLPAIFSQLLASALVTGCDDHLEPASSKLFGGFESDATIRTQL